MPASTIVASAGTFRLYDDSVQTFDNLPLGTYTISFSQLSGYSLHRAEPLATGQETVYGNHAARVQRIVAGYAAMNRSLGVIFSGDKGMGKSLMIRMLAERMREQHRLPTVLVQHSTPGLASFLDELGEAVVVFDEFEKVFASKGEDESQNQFLSLFDGLSTTKRLYVLSVNELSQVNDYMLNRPGRFHYHMRFAYPEPETVATYLRDQVPGISDAQIDEVVDFSRKYDLNFDHLRAIVGIHRRCHLERCTCHQVVHPALHLSWVEPISDPAREMGRRTHRPLGASDHDLPEPYRRSAAPNGDSTRGRAPHTRAREARGPQLQDITSLRCRIEARLALVPVSFPDGIADEEVSCGYRCGGLCTPAAFHRP